MTAARGDVWRFCDDFAAFDGQADRSRQPPDNPFSSKRAYTGANACVRKSFKPLRKTKGRHTGYNFFGYRLGLSAHALSPHLVKVLQCKIGLCHCTAGVQGLLQAGMKPAARRTA